MIRKLWIKQFRNINELLITLDGFEHIYIYGRNNQGKTSFLESVYCLGAGKSPIDQDPTHFIQMGKQGAYIGAELNNNDQNTRVYMKLLTDGSRGIQIDDQEVRQLKKVRECVPVDYISADIIRLFQGYPSLRRQFLDRYLCAYNIEYDRQFKALKQVLKQKSMVLQTGGNPDLLNHQLAQYSQIICSHRHDLLKKIEAVLSSYLSELGIFPFESCEITYQTEENLLARLNQGKHKELAAKKCLYGPQRDDFQVCLDGREVAFFYSRGINRVFSLLLHISLFSLGQKAEKPTLLLDDTLAEVDSAVKKDIITLILSKFQVFYTTVSEGDEVFFTNTKGFEMKEGHLIEAT